MKGAVVVAEKKPDKGAVPFSASAHLLLELGERLVSRPGVAVAELVKNGYDADARHVWVWYDEKQGDLVIEDDGHGLGKETFLNHWMVVASDSKRQRDTSRFFGRPLAGAKGIGRFATSFLGATLELVSWSFSQERDRWEELRATFDWAQIVKGTKLSSVQIPYEVRPSPRESAGTRLTISGLKQDWKFSPADDEDEDGAYRSRLAQDLRRAVGNEIAELCAPYIEQAKGTAAVDFGRPPPKEPIRDPGFQALFAKPGEKANPRTSVIEEIKEHARSTIKVSIRGKKMAVTMTVDGNKRPALSIPLPFDLHADVDGLIHHLPWESEVLTGLENITGTNARRWINENSGVRVFYQGFRMRPYGEPDDDWLWLNTTKALNQRNPRSTVTKALLPNPDSLVPAELNPSRTEKDPMLKLPHTRQLLGIIEIQAPSQAIPDQSQEHLIPAANREGFVANPAFVLLQESIRGALELLAYELTRHKLAEMRRELEADRKARLSVVQGAIRKVSARRDLPATAKKEIVKELKRVEQIQSDLEVKQDKALERTQAIGLLGGLAGFLTHEFREIERALGVLIDRLKEGAGGKATKALIDDLELRYGQVTQQNQYVRLFLGQLSGAKPQRLNAWGQVEHVLEALSGQTKPRGIEIINDVPEDLETPPTHLVVYSGIIMNLVTNAVKWVIDPSNTQGSRKVRITAWNDREKHVVQVSDCGPGVPEGMEDLIFMPTVTFTDANNPLHTGMGLGLSICRDMARKMRGDVYVADPPAGYRTAFEFTFQGVRE